MIGYVLQSSPQVASTLKHVFTTITSPAFSEVTIIYQELDFGASYKPWVAIYTYGTSEREMSSQHRTMFEVFHEIQEIRDFRLVLHVEAWRPLVECIVQELERAVNTGWVERGSEKNSSRPVVTSSLQVFLPDTGILNSVQMGWCGPFQPWFIQHYF